MYRKLVVGGPHKVTKHSTDDRKYPTSGWHKGSPELDISSFDYDKTLGDAGVYTY